MDTNFPVLTLRQLRTLLPSTEGVSVPSRLWLRNHASDIAYSFSYGNAHINIYKNGFYTYTQEKYTCILRVDGFSRLRFESSTNESGFETVDEKEYIDKSCLIALFSFGETRWNRNAEKRKMYSTSLVIDVNDENFQCIGAFSEPCFLDRQRELKNREERIRQLYIALNELKFQQKQAVELHFFQKLTQPEIADILGISQQAVSGRLKRAINTLKKKC